ncbi:MAG: acetoin utilization protein AcuC [Gammaproteobacteria bacterium]
MKNVSVYIGDKLARYGFGSEHPFGTDRMSAFWDYAVQHDINERVIIKEPVDATDEQILLFHTADYLKHVKKCSIDAKGYIDCGDTPAIKGIYESALTVVGTTLDAVKAVMNQSIKRAFIPIAGLHHATRSSAAGFCVFNDCGIAIEYLKNQYGLNRIAYVDIDAHHGDGVFYAFESDPGVIFADIHEDGRTLYPGTGATTETGHGIAAGTKLNLPVKADSDDEVFMAEWTKIEAFLVKHQPEFILLQCGADSISGDPITHLNFSTRAHSHAAKRLCELANDLCQGRLVVLGGGGYNRTNLAQTWTAVVEALINNS